MKYWVQSIVSFILTFFLLFQGLNLFFITSFKGGSDFYILLVVVWTFLLIALFNSFIWQGFKKKKFYIMIGILFCVSLICIGFVEMSKTYDNSITAMESADIDLTQYTIPLFGENTNSK